MRAITSVSVLAWALLAASCGSGGSSTPSSPSASPTSAPNAVTVSITSQNGAQSFSPNPADAGGQMVVFRNNDSITHRVVLNDGTIDTGDIPPGATSRAVLMPSSGTNYHCALHPNMIGAVAGTSGEPPACQGAYCTPDGY